MSVTSKKKAVFIIFLCACCVGAKPVFAKNNKGRWAVGSRGYYVALDDADYKSHPTAVSGNVTYGLSELIDAEFEFFYYEVKSRANTDLNVFTFHTNLHLKAPTEEWVPYAIVGLGGQIYKYDAIGVDDRRDKSSSISYKTGFGIEHFFNDHLAINFEVFYIYGNTGGRGSLDTYGWMYGGGLKYFF